MQKQGVADRLKKLLGIAATQARRLGRWLVNALIVALRALWWLISFCWVWVGRLLCSIWRSIPNYLPFYLTVVVVLYGLYFGWKPATVISPFNLPSENKDRPLPFGGETIANEMLDALNSLQVEATGREKSGVRILAPRQQDQKEVVGWIAPSEPLVEVQRKFAVEVKGFSAEGLVSFARELLRKEQLISGDLLLEEGGKVRLVARGSKGGRWSSQSYPATPEGLEKSTCELAELIWKTLAPNLMGAVYIHRGRFDDAVTLYNKSLDMDWRSLTNFGIALSEAGKTQEAVEKFRQALKLQPRSPELLYYLGNALLAKNDLDGAIAEYREDLRLKPGHPEAHNNLGVALSYKHDLDGAIAEYREALRLKPDYAEAHSNLGNALSDKHDLDGAIAEYREALRLKRDYADAHSNLGVALSHKHDLDGAIAEYRDALRLKPDFPEAHDNLGNALADKHNLGGAIAEYREAVRLKPDYAEAHNDLGFALANEHKLDEAIAQFRTSLQLKPDLLLAQKNLQLALQAKADKTRASGKVHDGVRPQPK